MVANTPNDQPRVIQFINEVARNASEFPEVIENYADRVRRDIISDTTRREVQGNLVAGEVRDLAETSADWLSRPVNLIMAVVAVVGAVLLIRRL